MRVLPRPSGDDFNGMHRSRDLLNTLAAITDKKAGFRGLRSVFGYSQSRGHPNTGGGAGGGRLMCPALR
jgi:hypothetical protein